MNDSNKDEKIFFIIGSCLLKILLFAPRRVHENMREVVLFQFSGRY